MKVDIYRLSSSRWNEYKEIRLRALKENPEAFGKSFDDEKVVHIGSMWVEK